ncbi:MAG: SDR family oxidoreductase, partial [Acidimicrobiales bacterium]
SRGIGSATAVLAAERGYDVAVTYLERGAEAEEVADRCRSVGGRAVALQADVADEQQVVDVFAEVDRQLGPLRALVVNAGIVAPQGRVETFSAERVQRVLAVNVVGAFMCAREAIRRLSTAHAGAGGAVVFVSSRASVLGSPGEYVDYAASKGAVDTMTVGLAREVAGEGIRVNAVRPGLIRTEIHGSGGDPGRADRLGPSIPMGRPGEPDEVARAILWLLSDEASYVTGALVDIGGGR